MQALNRIELVAETMRAALNSLATAAPAWLHAQADPEWVNRYAIRLADDRLATNQEQRIALATTIGRDGAALLTSVVHPDTPPWLREVPAIRVLQRIWIQNYVPEASGVRWRTADDGLPPRGSPASDFVSSPYDPDAHYAHKARPSGLATKSI